MHAHDFDSSKPCTRSLVVATTWLACAAMWFGCATDQAASPAPAAPLSADTQVVSDTGPAEVSDAASTASLDQVPPGDTPANADTEPGPESEVIEDQDVAPSLDAPGPGPDQGALADSADSAQGDDDSESGPTVDAGLPEADTTDEPAPELSLEFSEPPTEVPEGSLYAADIAYGPHEKNAFDILLPPSETPTPLVIHIHGGGFTGGDKSGSYSGNANNIRTYLEAGIAFATINYRLLQQVDSEGVHKPLHDSRRCLQFIRYHAESFNINPDAIAAYGGSAGAGTSLWLGSHDDMAQPQATDPVERESTRLNAVGLLETQATYDVVRWEEIFASYGITLEVVAAAGYEQRLKSFYGIETLEELYEEETVAYRADVDMLALMDSTDAAVWIYSGNTEEVFPVSTNILFHHPYHAQAVMLRAEEVGLEVSASLPVLGIETEDIVPLTEFFITRLQSL